MGMWPNIFTYMCYSKTKCNLYFTCYFAKDVLETNMPTELGIYANCSKYPMCIYGGYMCIYPTYEAYTLKLSCTKY